MVIVTSGHHPYYKQDFHSPLHLSMLKYGILCVYMVEHCNINATKFGQNILEEFKKRITEIKSPIYFSHNAVKTYI